MWPITCLGKETYQLPMMVTSEVSPLRVKIFLRACSRLLPPSGCSFFIQSLSSCRLGETDNGNLTVVLSLSDSPGQIQAHSSQL